MADAKFKTTPYMDDLIKSMGIEKAHFLQAMANKSGVSLTKPVGKPFISQYMLNPPKVIKK